MPTANRDPNELRTLSALLAQPEDDAIDALREVLPQASWLADAIADLEQIPLEHWQAGHTRLFLNSWPRTPCPPFESAYRRGQMGGTSAADLGDLYRRAGLQAAQAPPDYLGTLLECTAWLAEQPDGAALLRELEQKHLDRWVPRFARDLQANAQLVLYRTLGARIAALFPEEGTRD